MSALLAALPVIGSLIDKIFPDADARDKAKLAMLEMQQKGELAELDAELQLALGQIATNTAEAASDNWFVAGWRPAVGWVCATGICWNFVLQPLVMWAGAFRVPEIAVPTLEVDQLMVLLLGMLGIGGMRSFDKLKGTSGVNR